MVKLFGFDIKRNDEALDIPSFAPKNDDEGSLVISAGGTYGTYLDLEGSAKNEAEVVAKYRELAAQPEMDMAISDIVSEVIVKEDNNPVVTLNLDSLYYSDTVKERIISEFDKVLELFDFNNNGYDIFYRWYVDGRLYYHAMIDMKDPSSGIHEMRYIDPRKIRKVKSVKKVRKDNIVTTVQDAEFFMYNDQGFNSVMPGIGTDNKGLKISVDSIVHVTSGVIDKDNKIVLGYLHKAIRPMNQLRILEDAVVIYRIARAPERRIFNVNVGNLPKMKAEQHVRDLMTKHRNKLVYDATTGDVKDSRKFMTMLEDFWFPHRGDGQGTRVDTLPAGQNLGELADVLYFEKKLYQALNIPISRLNSDTGFSLGRSSEVTRDELKFQKFILRLRTRFGNLLLKTLEKQLILTGVIADTDWNLIKNKIHLVWQRDNYFSELKNSEILSNRLNMLGLVSPYVGKYYSDEWVRKNILFFTDEEIEEQDSEIQAEVIINFNQQKKQLELQASLAPEQNKLPTTMGNDDIDSSEPRITQ